MEKNERYLKLNIDLVELPTLSSRAKLLYGYIVALSQKNGYCFATNAFFVKKLKVSERTVTRIVSELRNAGLISCTWGAVKMADSEGLFFGGELAKFVC